jgi:hypothetical protein
LKRCCAQNVGEIDYRALDSISTFEAPSSQHSSTSKNFTLPFPVGTTLGIPMTFFFYALGSNLDRLERIYYFLPAYLIFLSVIIPTFLIFGNPKMRKMLSQSFDDKVQNLLASWKKQKSNAILPLE